MSGGGRVGRALAEWGALVAALLLCLCAPAGAAEDPNLSQSLDADQPVVTGPKALSAGHVDVGPRFLDGRWTLLVHDDVAKADPGGESVWRHPEQTVLWVTDDALREVPDDPAYGFLPAAPGADVYVVPQTQDPDVVWVGWNTQDPEVMARIDRGVTMTLLGVEGPGGLVVYLQSGDFSEPEVLWDSAAAAKPIWVDVNTHTHANWVFSEPGVYLARVRIEAELIDGSTVADTRDLRFAVGSGTAPKEALATAWEGPELREAAAPNEPQPAGPTDQEGGGPSAGLIAAIVLAALGLAGALAAVLMRGKQAKRRARS